MLKSVGTALSFPSLFLSATDLGNGWNSISLAVVAISVSGIIHLSLHLLLLIVMFFQTNAGKLKHQ